MAGKKTRKNLDGLRGDIQELAEAFAAFRNQMATQQAAAAAERQQLGKGGMPESQTYEAKAIPLDGASYISLNGRFETGSVDKEPSDYTWILERRPIEAMLSIPLEHQAQRLAAIGHPQRLGILLMLLDRSATANDVVARLELGTTGAAYHHLNVLQAAGLVEQRQRGTFSLIPNQVPVLLTVLAALSGSISVEVSTPPDEAEPDDVAHQHAKGKKHHA